MKPQHGLFKVCASPTHLTQHGSFEGFHSKSAYNHSKSALV